MQPLLKPEHFLDPIISLKTAYINEPPHYTCDDKTQPWIVFMLNNTVLGQNETF